MADSLSHCVRRPTVFGAVAIMFYNENLYVESTRADCFRLLYCFYRRTVEKRKNFCVGGWIVSSSRYLAHRENGRDPLRMSINLHPLSGSHDTLGPRL